MSGLSCAEFVELVTAYLEGALDADAERHLLDHLDECAGCDRYLDQVWLTVRERGTLPSEGLTGAARERVLAVFRRWRATLGA